jgi:glutamate racemase
MGTVRCHIYKNWASDNGYVDVISTTGTVARMYKHAYHNLKPGSRDRTLTATLLVELVVSLDRRKNVVQHENYIMEYDMDLTIDEMKRIADSPITELFESIDELPSFEPKIQTV